MSSYGITPAFADLVLGTLQNTPLTVPIACLQLHNGAPGLGTANVSPAVSTRAQVTFASPAAGVITITGGAPTFNVTAEDQIVAASLWNGFSTDPSAICLLTMQAAPPITIAQGDVLNVTGLTFTWQGLAS